MNKKNSAIIAIVLLLLLGTGSFVFAGSPEEKRENNKNNQTTEQKKDNNTINNDKVQTPPVVKDPEDLDENDKTDGVLTPEDSNSSNSNNDITNSVQINRPSGGNNNNNNKPSNPGNNKPENPGDNIPNNPSTDEDKPEIPTNPDIPENPSNPEDENDDYSYEDVLEAVKRAETTLDPEDIEKALELLDKLESSDKKTELENRLEVLKKENDLTKMLEKIKEDIKKSTTKQDLLDIYDSINIENIQNQINHLPDNFKKEKLKETLEEILVILEDNEAPIISGIENNAITKESVTITINDPDAIILLDNEEITLEALNELTQQKENKTYNLKVIDQSFNESSLTFTIDTIVPTVELEYDHDLQTTINQMITVKLVNMSEKIIITNNEGKDSYTFKENGEFTFEFQDKAGNTNTITAKVENIDLKKPEYKKLGIVNFSRIGTDKRLDIAYVDDIVKVYVTFDEKLKNNPIIQLNGIELETIFDEVNSSLTNAVYSANYKIDAMTKEDFMEVLITNIEDEAGNKSEDLKTENINVDEHKRMYVIINPGLEVVDGGYFSDKIITIKDPDFHHMTIKRSLTKPVTLYTNTYKIPGTGTYTITVYNENDEEIIPASKMTYDGFAPTINAHGYIDDSLSEKIAENNEEIKDYKSVKLEVTDATSLQFIRRVDEEGNVLEIYKECDPIKKNNTVTLTISDEGEYIIEALDATKNKTTVRFNIKN